MLAIERASFGREAWSPEAFVQYLERWPELFLVARIGRRIAGYSLASIDAYGAELDSIAVDPKYRGRGIAVGLLNATVNRLRGEGIGTLRLAVSTSNDRAIEVYREYGFVRTRRLKDYYARGRDAWRMRVAITARSARP